MELFINIILGILFIAMLAVFFISARHFMRCFINSTPPPGILGKLFEIYTCFFDKYLTKEGIIHRDKFLKWFTGFLLLACIWALGIIYLHDQVKAL